MDINLFVLMPLALGVVSFAWALYVLSGFSFVDKKNASEKARLKLKEQIKKKLDIGIALEAAEIDDIGRGLKLSSRESIAVLYELYSEAEEAEAHHRFRMLIDKISLAEPFESYPAEVRPSLARLSHICQESSQSSDKELLHPITKILGDYQEMKRDHLLIKSRSRISYFVGLFGVIVAIVGLALAFSGPSKEFISDELKQSTLTIQELIKSNKSVQGDVPLLQDR